jgi:hypothetical protein
VLAARELDVIVDAEMIHHCCAHTSNCQS